MSDRAYRIIPGEQRTDDWDEVRQGKITGSIAKNVKGTGNAFLYETLAKMTTERKDKKATGEHIERGIELEPEARAEYEKATGNKVYTVAFIEEIEDSQGRIGFSPDGVVVKDKKKVNIDTLIIKKTIEIKCPDTNNHIRYILENKIPNEHVDQIIHEFVTVDTCDEVDFVSYDPKFILKPLLIITARRKDFLLDIQTAKIAYIKFLEKLDASYSKLIQ